MNDTEARALDKQQYATAFYCCLMTVEAGNSKRSTPIYFFRKLLIPLFKITLTLHNTACGTSFSCTHQNYQTALPVTRFPVATTPQLQPPLLSNKQRCPAWFAVATNPFIFHAACGMVHSCSHPFRILPTACFACVTAAICTCNASWCEGCLCPAAIAETAARKVSPVASKWKTGSLPAVCVWQVASKLRSSCNRKIIHNASIWHGCTEIKLEAPCQLASGFEHQEASYASIHRMVLVRSLRGLCCTTS